MNVFTKLLEQGEKYQFLFFLLLIILFLSWAFFIYSRFQKIKAEKLQLKKLSEEQKKRAEKIIQQEKKLVDFNQQLTSNAEKFKFTEQRLEQEARNIKNLSEQLF